MENKIKSRWFRGVLTINFENSSLINKYLKVGSRFSVWMENTISQACQIERIFSKSGKIFPGETVEIEFQIPEINIGMDLHVGDTIFFGLPYESIVGTIKIQSENG